MTSPPRSNSADFPYAEIGKRLETLIAIHDIDQAQFASRLGLKQSTVSGWISGVRRPGIDSGIAIRKVFHITLDWLYDGDRGTLPVKIDDAIRHGKKLK
jgi:transcriptional regulator with XRE-family HTH domain